MPLQTVTRTQVIELAKTMPTSKLASSYKYGLFIQSRPRMVVLPQAKEEEDKADKILWQSLLCWW